MPHPSRSEDHLVWPIAPPQAEVAREVAHQHLLLLDAGDEGLIDLLLVVCSLAGHLLLLRLALVEEGLLTALLVGLLVAGEVVGAADLVYRRRVEAVRGDAGFGGDDIASVDAAERDTVDLERAGDEEDALVEDFEEHDTLAAETAGEEDEHLAGGEGLAGLVGSLCFAGLGGDKD